MAPAVASCASPSAALTGPEPGERPVNHRSAAGCEECTQELLSVHPLALWQAVSGGVLRCQPVGEPQTLVVGGRFQRRVDSLVESLTSILVASIAFDSPLVRRQ